MMCFVMCFTARSIVLFRCVDEVVIGAPYGVSKSLMEHFKVRTHYSNSNPEKNH
jgi:hypothetical protein